MPLCPLGPNEATEVLFALQLFERNTGNSNERLSDAISELRERILKTQYILPSSIDNITLNLNRLEIKIGYLRLKQEKMAPLQAIGATDIGNSVLSAANLKEMIRMSQKHVSQVRAIPDMGGHWQSETGRRFVLDLILLRLSAIIQTGRLVIHGQCPVRNSLDVDNPFILEENQIGAAIFEVEKGDYGSQKQAIVLASSYCKQRRLKYLRGALTSGLRWMFFFYKDNENGFGGQATLSMPVELGDNYENLEVVVGLLKVWVESANTLGLIDEYFYPFEPLFRALDAY